MCFNVFLFSGRNADVKPRKTSMNKAMYYAFLQKFQVLRRSTNSVTDYRRSYVRLLKLMPIFRYASFSIERSRYSPIFLEVSILIYKILLFLFSRTNREDRQIGRSALILSYLLLPLCIVPYIYHPIS